MASRSTGVSAFDSSVWGGWALGLVGGLFFLAFGIVGLVSTPDLFQATEAVNPFWYPLVMSLAVGGASLVLASALVAERRHRSLRALRETQSAHRARSRNRVVMGLHEKGAAEEPKRSRSRWGVLVLLALLVGAVAGAALVAQGLDPFTYLPLP